jgi:hypothetical protein
MDTFSLDQYTDVLLYWTQIKLNEIEAYNCYQVVHKSQMDWNNCWDTCLACVRIYHCWLDKPGPSYVDQVITFLEAPQLLEGIFCL